MRPSSALAVLLCGLWPAVSRAQQSAQPGAQQNAQQAEQLAGQPAFQFSPALLLSEVYDDQFAVPGAPSGQPFLTVASPSLGLRFEGDRLVLAGHGSLDLEMLDAQPARGLPYRRWAADAALGAKATERLTLTVHAALLDSSSPRDVSLITGLDQGLVHLTTGNLDGAVNFAATSLVSASLDAGYAGTRQAGLDSGVLSLRAGVADRITVLDTGRLQIVWRSFTFDGGSSSAATSFLAGWDRRLSEHLRLELLAGPRFTDGRIEGVEGTAGLRWEQPLLDVTLALSSTQGAVPGLVGLVDTTSASLQVTLRPTARLALSATPAAYVSSGAPVDAQVFELRLDATQAVSDWVRLFAGYRFAAQHATFADPATALAGRFHHQIVVGIALSAPPAQGQARSQPGSPPQQPPRTGAP